MRFGRDVPGGLNGSFPVEPPSLRYVAVAASPTRHGVSNGAARRRALIYANERATSAPGKHCDPMTPMRSHTRPTALVVDDDALMRMDVADMLEQAGFATREAQDGDAALEVLERHAAEVSLLFSDVEMPGTRDGFALAREVAARWPAISVVIVSGRIVPRPGELPDGVRFIPKPFSCETVHGHLRELLPDDRKPPELRR